MCTQINLFWIDWAPADAAVRYVRREGRGRGSGLRRLSLLLQARLSRGGGQDQLHFFFFINFTTLQNVAQLKPPQKLFKMPFLNNLALLKIVKIV